MATAPSAVLFELEPGHPLCYGLLEGLSAEPGALERRRFPDGESYLRVLSSVHRRPAVILADLSDPDDKLLPLCFLCDTLRELGATRVGLVAPYLCYMRQDTRFHSGEAITSRSFASILSARLDWLVTVDPHLHRYHSLEEIYRIPTAAVHAAPAMASWLADRGEEVLLVGPDRESEQWLAGIAAGSGLPYLVGEKTRSGDRDVRVQLPALGDRARKAVIIDDVVSSGQTLLQCMSALQSQGVSDIDALVVHALFADRVEENLSTRGLQQLISTNTLPHASNRVDVSATIVAAVKPLLTCTA